MTHVNKPGQQAPKEYVRHTMTRKELQYNNISFLDVR